MGEDGAPYTDRDRRKVFISSALLGWTGVTIMELYAANSSQLLFYLPFFVAIGLPIAFLSTWLIGGPIIRRVMRRPVGWLRAALSGASAATIIAAISIVIGRLNGLRISYDPTYNFRLGYGDYLREVDGLLTPYGWLLLAQNTGIFIALGGAIGLAVRWAIGPGLTS